MKKHVVSIVLELDSESLLDLARALLGIKGFVRVTKLLSNYSKSDLNKAISQERLERSWKKHPTRVSRD